MAGKGTRKASRAARMLTTARSKAAKSRAGKALNKHKIESH